MAYPPSLHNMTYLALPGQPGSPNTVTSFDEPIDMLEACHDRIRRTLSLLERLITHISSHGIDEAARSAAADICRYFDLAAPQHHLDEERHIFPLLSNHVEPELRTLARRLTDEHQRFVDMWASLREPMTQWQDVLQLAQPPSYEWRALARDFIQLYRQQMGIEMQSRRRPSAMTEAGNRRNEG
jgi:hemerythrin-like domain-containing protein